MPGEFPKGELWLNRWHSGGIVNADSANTMYPEIVKTQYDFPWITTEAQAKALRKRHLNESYGKFSNRINIVGYALCLVPHTGDMAQMIEDVSRIEPTREDRRRAVFATISQLVAEGMRQNLKDRRNARISQTRT